MIITKPILFSGQMVRAILDGRKTMTRRVIKPQPGPMELNLIRDLETRKHGYGPRRPGDILYVRETWASALLNGGLEGFIDTFAYKADGSVRYSSRKAEDLPPNAISAWQPSIFMPKEAARIFLRVTDVRVERLQEISGVDITREGVGNGEFFDTLSDRAAFRKLWDSLRKSAADRAQYGWDANPWVWVISFERCEKP